MPARGARGAAWFKKTRGGRFARSFSMTGCIGGAETVEVLKEMLEQVGFEQVSVGVRPESAAFIRRWLPDSGLETRIAAADVSPIKPVRPRRGSETHPAG